MSNSHVIPATDHKLPKTASPLCFIMDRDFAFRQTLARELRLAGVESVEFSDSSRFMDMIDEQNPDIVLINLNKTAPQECVRALLALKECSYAGAVQLIGQCDLQFLELFATIGSEFALTMLSPLPKPIKVATLQRVILGRQLNVTRTLPAAIPLRDALAKNMVKFLYQPKIDLKKKIIVGAEVVARVSHPQHSLLTPDQFMKGAEEEVLLDLARLALVNAIRTSTHFLELGMILRLAINISADSLLKLPIYDLVLMHRPERDDWPGLVLEVPERQVLRRIEPLKARSIKLQQAGVSIAIDNFGRSSWSLDALNQLPFCEIKIDRSLVESCATNTSNKKICKTLIQMAHNFDIRAVAVGVSAEMDLRMLAALDCDMVQGFLFGKPMGAEEIMTSFHNLNAEPSVSVN